MADAELAASVSAGAKQLQLPLTLAQVDLLVAYVRLIERWNASYNLTAVREPRAMVVHHVLDCLAVIEPLRRQRGSLAETRLLDVGSGAGLPGLIVAVVEPALEVVCVDSVGKKVAFITHAAAGLGLQNLTAVHRRVQDMAAESFDIITSRAFASLADFLASTRSLLNDGGIWLAMKGKPPVAEMAALSNVEFHVEPVIVPGLNADRCLIWARPKGIRVSTCYS